MMDLPDKTELGLLPRLIAAAWFGSAASIPVFCFMLTLGRGATFIPGFLFFYGAVPILIGALFGFAVGVKILDPVSSTSKARAALRGIVVALLSNLVFMTLFLVQMEIARPDGSFGFALIVAMGGLSIMFFPVAASGALAGWALCNLSCRGDFWEWLLNLPRVTPATANVLNLVASVVVLVNCIAGVYYAASLVR
jgi:hypothetical protein